MTDEARQEIGKDCLRDYEHILRAGGGEVKLRFALIEQMREWLGE